MSTREWNERLRAVRETTPSRRFPGRAMTRGELADLVSAHVWEHHRQAAAIDRKYIAKLEAGTIGWPNVRYREALREILGIRTDEDLGFVNANARRAARPLDRADRREVDRGAAAYPGLAPTADLASLGQAFEAAFGVERLSRDDWLAKAERYGHDYMSMGAAHLQARIAGELVRLRSQLGSDPVLWSVAARLLTVTGKTLPSVGGPVGAMHWYRLGVRASDRSGDPATRVWVRARAALALAYEGAAQPLALSLASEALHLSDRPSLGRLNALLALAHLQVLKGDGVAALLIWDRSRRMFDRVGSDEQLSDFAIPEWRMATISSMLLARLGHEQLALAAQETADHTRPDSLPRFATHIELHRGLLMVKRGDVTEGLALARAALERLPPERHSLSLRLMMDEITRVAAGGATGT